MKKVLWPFPVRNGQPVKPEEIPYKTEPAPW
jgi:hypothetical protein